jgi:hypothetical protein
MSNQILPCDGCSQPADPAHIARRLERLAWSSRFRPLHIQSLLLAAIAPQKTEDFLYAPNSIFHREAATILEAAQVNPAGKSHETILAEFQKLGLMLTYVLECPLDEGSNAAALFEKQLPHAIARIRHSLKPKRVFLLGNDLLPFAPDFQSAAQPATILTTDLAMLREALRLS